MFKNLIPGEPSAAQPAEPRPDGELAGWRSDFDRMLGQLWSPNGDDVWESGLGCEVKDDEKQVVVRTDAPGFDPQDIDVQLSGNRLVVSAERRGQDEDGKVSHYGRFYRSMTVPQGIDAENVHADYKNGVLEIRLPKGPAANSKRISVST